MHEHLEDVLLVLVRVAGRPLRVLHGRRRLQGRPLRTRLLGCGQVRAFVVVVVVAAAAAAVVVVVMVMVVI